MRNCLMMFDALFQFKTLKRYTFLSHKSSFLHSEYLRILQNTNFEFKFKHRAPRSEFSPSISFEYCFPLRDYANLVRSEGV